MGSIFTAEFINKGKTSVSGYYALHVLNEPDKRQDFHVEPGKKLHISLDFSGFFYCSFSINQDSGERKTHYIEVRSTVDFLILQTFLAKNYNLEMLSANPNYHEFLE
jgi:hypothetical protein